MAALPALDHQGGEGAAAVDDAAEVDLQDVLPLLLGGLQEGAAVADTGVVDHDVGDAVGRGHLPGEGVDGGAVGDVHPVGVGRGGAEQAGEFDGALGAGQVEVADHDGGAVLGEGQRGGSSDAAAAAGDDGQLPGESRPLQAGAPAPTQAWALGPARAGGPFPARDGGSLEGGRGGRAVGVRGDFFDHLCHGGAFLEQCGPVPGGQGAPPQVGHPAVEVVAQRGADVAVPGEGDQLYRYGGRALPWPQQVGQHVGPVQRDPVYGVGGKGGLRVAGPRDDPFGGRQHVPPPRGQAEPPDGRGE